MDFGADRRGESEGQRHRLSISDGKSPGKTQANRASRGVSRGADDDGAAAEELRTGLELGVDLEPDDGKNPSPLNCFGGGHLKILARGVQSSGASRIAGVQDSKWTEEVVDGYLVMRPRRLPSGLLVAFSGRGVAPPGASSPTAYLARGLADAMSFPNIPIVRATQVHGKSAARIREAPPPVSVRDAGECDVLATDVADIALAVQTADCVAIVLAGNRSVAA